MNRRRFLYAITTLCAIKAIPCKKLLGEIPSSVVYEFEGITKSNIAQLISFFGGLSKLLGRDPVQATVLVKPNICLPYKSELGTTTSPLFLDVLCEYLITEGVTKIIVADHTLQNTADFQNIDIARVLKKYPSARLIIANEQRHFQPQIVNGKVLKNTEVLKLLERADLTINIATAKHHSATHISLALKNLMGLIWDRAVFHTSLDLHQAIADLALIIKPQVNIIDASRVLLNGGPTGPGPVIEENRFFASSDILALDAIVASRYAFGGKNLSPREVAHLWAAYENGVGQINPDKINVQRV